MKNWYSQELIFFIGSLVLTAAVFFNITSDFLKTRAQSKAISIQESLDPTKEFKSLDSYITYTLPAQWKKFEQVDYEFGNNTFITLTSPDFEASSEAMIANQGTALSITRSYDPVAEETLKNKLNAQYEFYNYNIRPLTIGGKNAMTMHEDYKGHFRFVFVAVGTHLWQISIATKSLEDEQKYEGDIDNFLNSIQFI